jgi:hypothetical protein
VTFGKKKFDSRTLYGLVTAACIVSLTACSNSDSSSDGTTDGTTDSGATTPDTGLVSASTLLTIQVVDAAGNAVDDASVDVIEDASNVVAVADESQNTGTGAGGIVIIEPGTFTGEADIQVRVSKDGFNANNVPVTLGSGQSVIQTIVIAAQGASTVNGIGADDASGSVQSAPLTIFAEAVPDINNDPGQTFVRIPANPGATTIDGTPLSNNLTINLTHYDADQNESLDAFPGGFAASASNPQDFVDSGVSTLDGANAVDGDGFVFQTLGFASIVVTDDAGNVAENFNSPLDLTMMIKNDAFNAAANRNYQAGDTVPIWSFDPVEGEWQFEQVGNIVGNGSGRLVVNFQTTHLTYYAMATVRGGICGDVTITYMLDGSSADTEVPTFTGRYSAEGYMHRFTSVGGTYILRDAPASLGLTLTDAQTLDGRAISVSPASFQCSNGQAQSETSTVTISGTPADTYSLTVEPVSFCLAPQEANDQPVTNSIVTLANGGNVWSGNTGADGSALFAGLLPGTYSVRVGSNQTATDVTIVDGSEEVELRFGQSCGGGTVTTGGSGTGG